MREQVAEKAQATEKAQQAVQHAQQLVKSLGHRPRRTSGASCAATTRPARPCWTKCSPTEHHRG